MPSKDGELDDRIQGMEGSNLVGDIALVFAGSFIWLLDEVLDEVLDEALFVDGMPRKIERLKDVKGWKS